MLKPSYQHRVGQWLLNTFGLEITSSAHERNQRFLEEALELVQSCDLSREAAHSLVDYVYNREKGDPWQEVGGTVVCLAALCHIQAIDFELAGEQELKRCLENSDKIKAKHGKKPQY